MRMMKKPKRKKAKPYKGTKARNQLARFLRAYWLMKPQSPNA